MFTLADFGYDSPLTGAEMVLKALGCFSVYASIHLSPPELQDSIRGGADYSFHGGTHTRKTCAAFLGARMVTDFFEKGNQSSP